MTGSSLKRGGGYAPFLYGGRIMNAHRVSWMLKHGEIPEGMLVCHHCDNPRCVRPDHLFLGTPRDNIQDMIKKGRDTRVRGMDHFHCKLTEEQVHEIRESNERGDCVRLARDFGVTPCTISHIRGRKTWAWLPERESTAV